jgi:hypothetical protein
VVRGTRKLFFNSYPLVHEGPGFRRPAHVVSVEVLELKAAILDQLADVPVEVATITKRALERIEAVLPALDFGIVRKPVLDKEEMAAGLEDAAGFLERLLDVRDAAKGPSADDVIELVVLEGEFLAIDDVMLDLDGRGVDPALGHGVHAGVHIGGDELADGRRVMGEVESGAEPDLEDFSRDVCERFDPGALHFPIRHDEIHEFRKYVSRVKAHGRISRGSKYARRLSDG